jgi:TonB-linked SusC/RagA family outer membrane protein
MKKIACLALIMLLGWQVSWAQDVLVKGVVTGAEDGLTIPGVSVVEKGTTNGTTTDFDGKYQINVGTDAILVFSYIGMKTFEMAVGSQIEINVALEADNFAMDEVVVVGYGVQKKSDLTGAVSTVKSDDLEKMSTATVLGAMQGKVAGVNITSTTGSPGAGMTVVIRGRGTVGNSSPLYVVDGLPLDNISFLNAKDIESTQVLKDASATAIYGSRGANGVIMITTKKAKQGELKVNIDAYRGVQKAWREPDLLNSKEWYDVINKANATAGKPDLVLNPVADDLNHTTDWFDEITRSAIIEDYNIQVSGGTENLKAMISGNYFNQEGLIKGSDYNRYSVRANTEFKVNEKLTIGENISISQSKRHSILEGNYFNGIVNSALKLDPITKPRDEDGKFVSSPYTDVKNPLAHIDHTYDTAKTLRIVGSAYADYKIFSDLIFRTNYGMDISVTDKSDFEPTYDMAKDEQNLVNSVFRSNSRTTAWTWSNTLTYTKTIEDHSLTLMAGIEAMESNTEWFSGSKNNLPNNEAYLRYLSSAAGDENGMGSTSGLATSYSMFSYLGRVNYSYKDKYLFTGNIRRDGSSKFGPDKRWGTFPTAAEKWKLTNEDFMKSVLEGDILSGISLRAGWGQIGNDKIALYQYSSVVSNNKQYGYVFGKDNAKQKLVYGGSIEGVGNEEIHWETTESTNIGLDMIFFNGKLNANFQYFVKKTKDMLLREPIPSFVGYTSAPYTNVGDVENKGIEIELGYKNNIGDLKYSVDFNFSKVKNEVVDLGNVDFMSAGYVRIANSTRTQVGHEIGAFYGYVTDGLFQNQAEITAHAGKDGTPMQSGAIPGDIRFKDLNKDGKIDAEDRTFIGSPHPDFTFGLNLNLNYKAFDLSMAWQGVYGNDIFNFMIFETMNPGKTTNKYDDILKSWNGEGSSNSIPVLNAADKNDNLRISDRYIEDGSYLRLKNFQIGYTLPQSLVSKINIDRMRVYLSGQNLLTITDYSGLEPEIGYYDSLSSGIDEGIFPHARTISLGVNVTF